MSKPFTIKVALTIAGSDSSGGAGLQADMKVFQHYRLHGLCSVTCVVAETAHSVRSIYQIPVQEVIAQAQLMLESFPVTAMKTGMLFSADCIEALSLLLAAHVPRVPLIIDPVMIASTGDSLITADAQAAYERDLLPLASLITPNIPEAEALCGAPITTEQDIIAAAKALSSRYQCAVLLKGGHLNQATCTDLLYEKNGNVTPFSSPRLTVKASHGTGCTLSAAITAQLAQGKTMLDAIAEAKSFLNQSLLHSYTFDHPECIAALNQGTHF